MVHDASRDFACEAALLEISRVGLPLFSSIVIALVPKQSSSGNS
jgi:hypothetical protein